MKVLLLMALFNINTSELHDIQVLQVFDTAEECSNASNRIEKPDENGDIKLYNCAMVVPKQKEKST